MTKKQWTGILLLAAALLVGVFADIASARMAQGDAVGVGVSAATVPYAIIRVSRRMVPDVSRKGA